jgi:hypothetical protein
MSELPSPPARPTSGPWYYSWLDDVHGWIRDHKGRYLAEIVTYDEEGLYVPKEEQLANSRLIAAAPQLREALDKLLSATIDVTRAAGNKLDYHEQEAMELALAAMTKADGF